MSILCDYNEQYCGSQKQQQTMCKFIFKEKFITNSILPTIYYEQSFIICYNILICHTHYTHQKRIILKNMGISTSDCRLNISTLTWNKLSFNLFDYESSDYSRTNLKIDCLGFLTRRGFEIDFTASHKEPDQVLLKVDYGKNQKYFLELTDVAGNHLNIMRVVKPEEEMLVKENDLIKLGRVELRIKRLEKEYFPDVRPVIEQCGKAGIGNECRFCFNQENQLTNPLLSPCQCKGSLKYIHLQCLRIWLCTRMKKEEKESIMKYHWENLKCELCHSNIESQIDLFQLDQSEQPSIAVQIAQSEDDQRKVSIFVIPIQRNKQKQIRIGRGKQNDIRINDISVSRQHCVLTVREGKAYLQDSGSKFGTLIECERQIKINGEEEVWLQSGRTLIKVTKEFNMD